MRTVKMEKRHKELLAEYGLGSIPAQECRRVLYDPGEAVSQEGFEITELQLVFRGRAKVLRLSGNGKSLIVAQYISKGLIGEIELMVGLHTATSTTSAISELECIAIPFDRCRVELKHNIVFSNKIGQELATKLAHSADNFVSSALLPAKQRLCMYFLQNADGDIFRGMMTEAAASIGMSYRHLSRLVSDLCEDGVLQKEETGYRLLDTETLRKNAGLEQEGKPS